MLASGETATLLALLMLVGGRLGGADGGPEASPPFNASTAAGIGGPPPEAGVPTRDGGPEGGPIEGDPTADAAVDGGGTKCVLKTYA